MTQQRGHRRAERETNEAEILAAAERLFATRGFHGVSLEQIGQAAGFSRGTPGYFFGTKERLYGVVVERAFGRARTRLRPVYREFLESPPASRTELLPTLVRAHLNLFAEEPSLVRLLQWESLRRSEAPGVEAEGGALAEMLPDPADSKGAGAVPLLALLALCWFPFGHRAIASETVGLDPRDPTFLSEYAEIVVAFLASRLSSAPRVSAT